MDFSFGNLFLARNDNPMNISVVVMEYEHKHIEADFGKRQITCRNVISPAWGDMRFSAGYFDPHSAAMDAKLLAQLNERLLKCIQNMPFETKLTPLPFGASADAYMRYRDRNGNEYYYSTLRPAKDGFTLESIPVHREFCELFQLLLTKCAFSGDAVDAWDK